MKIKYLIVVGCLMAISAFAAYKYASLPIEILGSKEIEYKGGFSYEITVFQYDGKKFISSNKGGIIQIN